MSSEGFEGTRLIMFGGRWMNKVLGDTWVFSGDAGWIELNFTSTNINLKVLSSPAARHSHAMAPLGDDAIVLFGGVTNGDLGPKDIVTLEDTWVLKSDYDHGDAVWTELQLIGGLHPEARFGHAMGSLGGLLVLLFGGEDRSGELMPETWTFSTVKGWDNITADTIDNKNYNATDPPSRQGHAMASLTSSEGYVSEHSTFEREGAPFHHFR
jgi:hypothetical protein